MATLEQIHARIAKLQNQADDLERKRKSAVIKGIHKTMALHGLTLADLGGGAPTLTDKRRGRPLGSTTVKRAGGGASVAAKGKLPPKYRNPEAGETWSGRARPPAWIKDAQDRDAFLISAAGAATKAAAKKTVAKKAKAKPVSTKVVAKKVGRKPSIKSAPIAVKKTRGRPKGSVSKVAKRASRSNDAAVPSAPEAVVERSS